MDEKRHPALVAVAGNAGDIGDVFIFCCCKAGSCFLYCLLRGSNLGTMLFGNLVGILRDQVWKEVSRKCQYRAEAAY